MLDIAIFTQKNKPIEDDREQFVDFLFQQLEQFGDPREDIDKCMAYALEESRSFGGTVLAAYLDGKLVGVVILNKTGMKGYIPENILVYIATHKDVRGKGVGKELMIKAAEVTDGDIALHVEPDNPARFLYEKVGYSSKYLEMRYKRS